MTFYLMFWRLFNVISSLYQRLFFISCVKVLEEIFLFRVNYLAFNDFFNSKFMTFDDVSRSLLSLDPLRSRAELHRLRDGLQRLHRPLQRRRVSQQTEQSHKS
jgi:hypothetical protein